MRPHKTGPNKSLDLMKKEACPERDRLPAFSQRVQFLHVLRLCHPHVRERLP